MGDCNAVELGQRAHVELCLKSRIFSPFELLTAQGRAPRGAMAAGIVIDDVILAEQLPCEADALQSEGVRRLNALCEEYLQARAVSSPSEDLPRHGTSKFLGCLSQWA